MKTYEFHKGQVVMVNDWCSKYPIKLVKRTGIRPGPAWFDSLGNIVLEQYMRPLTPKERRQNWCGSPRTANTSSSLQLKRKQTISAKRDRN